MTFGGSSPLCKTLRGDKFRDRIWIAPLPSSSPGFRMYQRNSFSTLMKLIHPIGKRGGRNLSSFRRLLRTLICTVPSIEESSSDAPPLRVSIRRCRLPIASLFKCRPLSIFHMRIRDGIGFPILVQPLPYLSKELLLEYVCEVFLPAVEVNRELPECRGKLAILFWDSCLCHCSDDILRELPSHGFF
jgi:hypothetical protein